MAVRPPALRQSDSILDPLAAEIMGEKAASLGRAGEKVERSLRALRAHEGPLQTAQLFCERPCRRCMPISSSVSCAACDATTTSSANAAFRARCWSGWVRNRAGLARHFDMWT